MILPDKGLDHPDGHQIFLQGVVQVVNPGLHGFKQLGAQHHQHTDHHNHQRNHHHQHQGQPGVEGDADNQRGKQHHRGAHQHPQAHGQHHGHGVDVVGHPGNEGGRGKPIDVGKGKLLHLVKQALAQVGPEALAGKGGILGREDAAEHGNAGQHQHQKAQLKNIGFVPGGNGGIHDLRHHQGQQKLADDLQDYQNGRLDGIPLIALKVGEK